MISKIALMIISILGCSCSHVPSGSTHPKITTVRSSVVVQNNETVWWRTDGATVIGTKQDCSLYLDHKPSVIFVWRKNHTFVGLTDDSFHFSNPPEMALVAIKADDKWLDSDKPSFLASGLLSVLTVSFEDNSKNFNDLLHTSRITVKMISENSKGMTEINADIHHPKMTQLLDAVNRCRQLL